MNFKWPKTEYNDWFPWYRIIFNTIVSPIFYIGIFMIIFAIFLCKGKNEAIEIYENFF